VHLGYADGVAQPSTEYGTPLYGNIISAAVRGRDVLELWPYDFPMNTRGSTTIEPLRVLWRPLLTGFTETHFGISGLELISAGGRRRWVAQRWFCMPVSLADILRNLEQDRQRRPRAIEPMVSEKRGHARDRPLG